MAHVQKYTKAASGHLFAHYERKKDEDGKYVDFGNQEIDTNKSVLNYNLTPERDCSQGEFVKKRCSEIHCLNRKDVNVMCSWVVTLPKGFADQKEEEREFFQKTYGFLENKYGEQNVISSHVHNDENQPHMHFSFIPVVYDKKKERYKLSAKECIDKFKLKAFHPELNEYLEKHFGREIGVLNEATREGNKSIEELKRESATERLHKASSEASKLISNAHESVRGIETSSLSLKAEYESLKAFVDESDRISDVSMMYPNYAEVSKRGIIKKQEFVTVPKEKWEAKHVSANQIEALKKERKALERTIQEFNTSDIFKENENLKKELKNAQEKSKGYDKIMAIFKHDKGVREAFKSFFANQKEKERLKKLEEQKQKKIKDMSMKKKKERIQEKKLEFGQGNKRLDDVIAEAKENIKEKTPNKENVRTMDDWKGKIAEKRKDEKKEYINTLKKETSRSSGRDR